MMVARKGFTLVELLIVIVVIGILAAITLAVYNGIQTKAQDARRASDLQSIAQAIGIYNAVHNGAPLVSSFTSQQHSGWDASTDSDWLKFLTADNGPMPVDPVNTLTVANNPPSPGNFTYYYFCYLPSSYPQYTTPTVLIGYHKADNTTIDQKIPVANCI